jgi:hypothetical protein
MNRKALSAILLTAVAIVGCGGGGSGKSNSSAQAQGQPGALSAEAQSAATGDIPDNQNFLTYKGAGFSISYPEGWAQTGRGGDVSFRDKNNIVHIAVNSGAQPTAASVANELAKEKGRLPSLKAGAPHAIQLKGGNAVKVTYTTVSKPNPVTGKRVKLTVDRYVLARNGRVATIDLGTPIGVDNVDAYKLMAESFRWR